MQESTDYRSNENNQLVYAAQKIGRSDLKQRVFKAVYFGKQKIKTVQDIAKATGLDRKTVLDAARKLEVAKLIHQVSHKSDTAYVADNSYKGVWRKVLSLAGNKKKIDRIPTKERPAIKVKSSVTIKLPKGLATQTKIKNVTIDDIESFKKVLKFKNPNLGLAKMPETKFKRGILKILNEKGKPPKDWGGEKNDIYTTNLYIKGKRYHAAFALKGPGKKIKKLTPKHMGKNGDQIQRLHRSSAQVFFVRYWREIDESIPDLMEELAKAKACSEGRCIYFGIINGADSSRMIQAYPAAFK